MPHIIVKLASGHAEPEKYALAQAISAAVTKTLACDAAQVSVAIEEVVVDDWNDLVFGPDIAGKQNTLYVKPGYGEL